MTFHRAIGVFLCVGLLLVSSDAFAKPRRGAMPDLPAASQSAWSADHDRAVALARNGQYDQSLAIMQQLYKTHGDDVGVVRDYLVILGWAGGHDSQVITLYRTLPPDQPDYVLQVVGDAYRNMHRPLDALSIYQIGIHHSPNNANFAAGIIRSMTEAGYIENALAQADMDLQQHGNRIEVLLAAGSAAEQYDKKYRALGYYENAIQAEPGNREALGGLIRIEDRIGAAPLALKLANDNPGAVSSVEYRQIQGDIVAQHIRFGMADSGNESIRYKRTDESIVQLNTQIDQYARQGPEAQHALLRAKFDRILALRNRYMMQDVIGQYDQLVEQNVAMPNYVLSSVGDAYLYLHEPEKARDLYLQVLQTEPNNSDFRIALFYAYVDCNDWENAFATIDALAGEDKPGRAYAAIVAGQARLFAGDVQGADERIVPLAQAAPNNPTYREALGDLYAAHGWTRQALEQHQIGAAIRGGKNVSNEIGTAEAHLNLQDFQTANNQIQGLDQRMPDNTQVQRLDREWQVHNMWELRVKAGYEFEPMTTTPVTGGEGYGIDTVLYSPPIDYSWRIFAGEGFTHQHEPNDEGSIGISRSTAGVEYRARQWEADLAPTYNAYKGDGRVGVDTNSSVNFDDHWSAGLSGELFSRDTPLRALNSGTTADEVNGAVRWRQDETRSIRVGGNIMPFSDGNLRTGVGADYDQQVYAAPKWTVDGLVDVGESQNSKDSNRDYYNPKQDFIGLIGAQATQILYSRYTTVYKHSLTIEPGFYWQEYYGTSAALRMRYEQRVQFNNTFDAGAGVNFSRQAYDGSPENDVSLTLDLTERF